MVKLDLQGTWIFCMDGEKKGIHGEYYKNKFQDTIDLPTTVAVAKKGKLFNQENAGFLTDLYEFKGYTWYSRDIEFQNVLGK